MALTRQNHYVPEWYQKRFLSSDKKGFHYLDLNPPLITLPTGEKKPHNAIRRPRSPSKCFVEKDLYTLYFGGIITDAVERYLFGRIDDIGARAIDAMAKQDFKTLHENFQSFFEYLDIQKIRTPKGLVWLKSKYPNLTHNQLLHEMQQIQLMHCTIWYEAVREIVYANNSKIKFIVSDHPVTVYNPACNPRSPECAWPNEPRIEMKATQTIFPLDSNRCLILTNLDYAKNPHLSDPKTYRPNATPYRQALARMDNTICVRELKDEEVASINLIIKSRAKKFLAAEDEELLYPEKIIKGSWIEIGKVLLPPSNKLYQYGGEVFGQYEDGRHFYHDAYGRTTAEAEHLKKELPKDKVGVNDPCVCGSGKKYKKCCRDKAPEDRPSTTYRSIRERNIMFFNIVVKIIGFDGKKDWVQLRKELTDKKIVDIYKAVAALWPRETDLMSLLPRPDAKVSRAVYSGLMDPQVVCKDITALSLYVDEIIVINPFINPNVVTDEFNPIKNPDLFRQDTIKNVILLISLFSLIDSGKVNFIPEPIYFNRALFDQIMAEGEKRRKQIKLDDAVFKSMEKLAQDDLKRWLFNSSDDRIKARIKEVEPNITKEKLEDTLVYIKKQNEQDPFATLQPPSESKGGQMLAFRMNPNLELGMFLAQATGAFIVTTHPYRWSEICSSINYFYGDYQSPWELIVTHMTKLNIDFLYFLDPNDSFEALRNGDLAHIKSALRNIWNAVQVDKPTDPSQAVSLIEGFTQAKSKMDKSIEGFLKRKNDNNAEFLRVVKRGGKVSIRIAPAGHSTNSVYRLLLAHAGHDKYLKALPLSLYIEHDESDVEDKH